MSRGGAAPRAQGTGLRRGAWGGGSACRPVLDRSEGVTGVLHVVCGGACLHPKLIGGHHHAAKQAAGMQQACVPASWFCWWLSSSGSPASVAPGPPRLPQAGGDWCPCSCPPSSVGPFVRHWDPSWLLPLGPRPSPLLREALSPTVAQAGGSAGLHTSRQGAVMGQPGARPETRRPAPRPEGRLSPPQPPSPPSGHPNSPAQQYLQIFFVLINVVQL